MSATMIPLSNDKLLTDSEMRRLREGSYEDKVSRIRDAVLASASDHFTEGSTVEVLATHPNKAVVTADGFFFEVNLGETNGNEIRIVGVTPLKVESYDKDNLSQYVKHEAQQAVDLFFQGSTKAAVERIIATIPYVHPGDVASSSLESVQVEISKESTWKKTLDERSDEIAKLVSGQLGEDTTPALTAKFRTLYEETDAEKLAGYTTLVTEDLDSVIRRIRTLAEEVTQAATAFAKALEGKTIEDGGILGVFSAFVSGLEGDLLALGETATQTMLSISEDVAAKSKLHDMLIEGLRPYEVGARFAVAVSQRLD